MSNSKFKENLIVTRGFEINGEVVSVTLDLEDYLDAFSRKVEKEYQLSKDEYKPYDTLRVKLRQDGVKISSSMTFRIKGKGA